MVTMLSTCGLVLAVAAVGELLTNGWGLSLNNVINNATGPAAALIPSQVAACRGQALALVGDSENCHLFYRCDMLDTATPQVTHWAFVRVLVTQSKGVGNVEHKQLQLNINARLRLVVL